MAYDRNSGDYAFYEGECYDTGDGIFRINKDQAGNVQSNHYGVYVTGRRLCNRKYKPFKKSTVTRQPVNCLHTKVTEKHYEVMAEDFARVLAVLKQAIQSNKKAEDMLAAQANKVMKLE